MTTDQEIHTYSNESRWQIFTDSIMAATSCRRSDDTTIAGGDNFRVYVIGFTERVNHSYKVSSLLGVVNADLLKVPDVKVKDLEADLCQSFKFHQKKFLASLKGIDYEVHMSKGNYYFGEGKQDKEFLSSVFNEKTGQTYGELITSLRAQKRSERLGKDELSEQENLCFKSLREYSDDKEFCSNFAGMYVAMSVVEGIEKAIVYDADEDQVQLYNRISGGAGVLFMEYVPREDEHNLEEQALQLFEWN